MGNGWDGLGWGWIRKSYMKQETEGFVFATQGQALGTNGIIKDIDWLEVSEKRGIRWGKDK